MKVESARICDFKSVKDSGRVELEQDITTLLGKNESGKTAFLEAISSINTNEEYDESDIHSESSVNPFDPIVQLHLY